MLFSCELNISRRFFISETLRARMVSPLVSKAESDSRVFVTLNPRKLRRSEMSLEIVRLISFSSTPSELTAPPSSPPCGAYVLSLVHNLNLKIPIDYNHSCVIFLFFSYKYTINKFFNNISC